MKLSLPRLPKLKAIPAMPSLAHAHAHARLRLFGVHRLQLDFGRKQQRPQGTGLAAMAIGALALTLSLSQSDQVRGRLSDLESEVSTLGGNRKAERQRGKAASTARGPELDDRVRKANRVIRLLSTPWADAFGAIDAANGNDVALLGLDSDPAAAQVRATAEARNTKAMIEYLERLRLDGRLSPVVLQSHQIMTEDPNRPIRFTFAASWTSAK